MQFVWHRDVKLQLLLSCAIFHWLDSWNYLDITLISLKCYSYFEYNESQHSRAPRKARSIRCHQEIYSSTVKRTTREFIWQLWVCIEFGSFRPNPLTGDIMISGQWRLIPLEPISVRLAEHFDNHARPSPQYCKSSRCPINYQLSFNFIWLIIVTLGKKRSPFRILFRHKF